jgi:AcrR family transcriptional regulator
MKIKHIITQGAKDIFVKNGFENTKILDISRHIKKGKSSIYYHFKNKEEILAAIIMREAQKIEERIVKKLERQTDPMMKIREYFSTRMQMTEKIADIYTVFIKVYFEHLPKIKTLRQQIDQKEAAILCSILDEAKNRNIFFIDDTKKTTAALLSIIQSMEMSMLLSKNLKIQEISDELLNIFFYGIRKR